MITAIFSYFWIGILGLIWLTWTGFAVRDTYRVVQCIKHNWSLEGEGIVLTFWLIVHIGAAFVYSYYCYKITYG